ncbi:MAG: hypothetical protein ACFFEV_09285 [Candidatus Thorarchaeota archaeon]
MAQEKPVWEINKETTFASFIQVWDQSFQSKVEEYQRWFFPTFVHHQVYRCIWDSHEDKTSLQNSLLLHRFIGWRRSLQWCSFSAYSGAYEAIARELRFILEDLAQALYIDQQLGDSQILAKVKTVSVLEDTRLRGTGLIKKLDIDSDTKKQIKDLYDELCGFVHPSADLVTKGLTQLNYIFMFNERQFKFLMDIYVKTCDLVLSVVLAKYPEACERFQHFSKSENEEEVAITELFPLTFSICD